MKILLVENRPLAGFFSNLNVILAALMVLQQSNITDYYVVWQNISYGTAEENLFDKYFYKQTNIPDDSYKVIHAIQLAQPHLHKDNSFAFNEILTKHKFFDSKPYLEAIHRSAIKTKIDLGVHVRYNMQHHYEVPSLGSFIKKISQIQQELKITDKPFFLATDHSAVISAFNAEFSLSQFIFNDNVYRPEIFEGSTDHSDWHHKVDGETLALYALQEAVSLSLCEEVLYAGSNVVGFSSAINPGRYYHLLDTKPLSAWDGGMENVKKFIKQTRRLKVQL
jgi:hypothetical protein